MHIQAQAQELFLQILVLRELRHAAVMYDAPRVHHRHRIPERARGVEVLLDEEDRGVGLLELVKGFDQIIDDSRNINAD